MPLRLLIDGYNVISPTAPPRISDTLWLHRERMSLVHRLIKRLPPALCDQTCVVFDAKNPPRDRSSRFSCQGIDIRFAVNYPEADDLLEEIIAANHHPKQLTVVSSDHRVQSACKRRGATSFDSQPWLDDVLAGKLPLAKGIREKFLRTEEADREEADGAGQGRGSKSIGNLEAKEIEQWMQAFDSDPDTASETDQWMKEFGFDPEEPPAW